MPYGSGRFTGETFEEMKEKHRKKLAPPLEPDHPALASDVNSAIVFITQNRNLPLVLACASAPISEARKLRRNF